MPMRWLSAASLRGCLRSDGQMRRVRRGISLGGDAFGLWADGPRSTMDRLSRASISVDDRGEDGFTLIELVIVVVLIPLIIGGVTIVMITALKSSATNPNNPNYQQSAAQKLAESHDAQITSALVVRDVQSSSSIATTSSSPVCGSNGQSQVLGLEWFLGSNKVAVSYVVQSSSNPTFALVRQFCEMGSLTKSNAAHGLSSMSAVVPTLTCTTLNSNCNSDAQLGVVSSQDVALVQVVVSEASGFKYTISASPRQYEGSTAALVSSTPPLLVGAGGINCPGSTGMTVYGDVAVDHTYSPGNPAITIGKNGLTAQQVYTLGGTGSAVSGSYTQQPAGPPKYTTGPSLSDPYAALPAPSPFGANTYVYNSTLTTGNDTPTTLKSGIYILRNGMSATNLTSDPGGVFFYVTGGSLNESGNWSLNLSAMTSGTYAGILWYQVPTDTTTFSLAGNPTVSSFDGVIDVSGATVSLAGTANINLLGLVANKVTCSGGGNTVYSFGPSPTSTVVTSSSPGNTSLSGTPVTFTATVTPTPPGANPGSVSFTATPNGSNTPTMLCSSVPVTAGTATCNTSALVTAGSPYLITATYSGTLGFQGSSGTLTQTVVSPSSTAVTSSADPSVSGQPVTFTAKVSGTGTPTGTVTFTIKDTNNAPYNCSGGTNTIALSGGSASCTVAGGQLLAANSPFAVTASYGGDTRNGPSSGSLLGNQVVAPATTGTVIASSANPSTNNKTVTFTATVTPAAPGSGTPTGTVTFAITATGGAVLNCNGGNAQALTNGAATCKVTLSSSGSPYTITGTYGGDANYLTSSGTLIPPQTVK